MSEAPELVRTDPLGLETVYYARVAGGVIHALSVAEVLAGMDGPAEIDLQATGRYLTLGYVPAPRTMWKGIRKLPAGHRLTEAGEVEPCWRPAGETVTTDRPSAAVRSAVTTAVVRHLPERGSVWVPADLGGADALVARLAADAGADCRRLTLPEPDPSALLAAAASRDEPTGDLSAARANRIALASGGEPVLTGLGGEIVFADTFRHLAMRHGGTIAPWKYFLLRAFGWRRRPVAPERMLRDRPRYARFTASLDEVPAVQYFRLCRITPLAELSEAMERDFAASADAEGAKQRFCDAYEQNDYDNEPAYGQVYDLMIAARLPLSPEADIRMPLLDADLVSLAISLPASARFSPRCEPIALSEAFGELPPAVGAEPVADWLRGELAGRLRESLLEGPLVDCDWLRRPILKRWIDAHAAGADLTRRLWALLVLSEWLKRR